MANTSARMLRLLSLLQTHRYWPGPELAERLTVSPRTLRRDVDRLRELGYPVDAARGVAGGYQLQAGAAVPPLLLDDDEAVAIAIGLRTAAAGAVAGLEETSVRALAKVIQLLPPRLRRRVDAVRAMTSPGVLGGGPVLDAGALTTIAMACRGEERMRFGYTARAGEATRRHVEPHRLVSLGRRWYLMAWDLDRGDWRSFRLDRMTGPELTGARFRPREIPGGDPVAWLRSRLSSVPSRHDVSVRIAAPADRVRAVVGPWGSVEELDTESDVREGTEGHGRGGAEEQGREDAEKRGRGGAEGHGCGGAEERGRGSAEGGGQVGAGSAGESRLTMNIDDLNWAVLVLGTIGAPFTVESPPELIDAVRRVGEALLRGASPS